MDDRKKTKATLIEELNQLRRKLESVERQNPAGEKDICRRLLLNSAAPSFAIDRQHKVVLWNRACEELTGRTASEVLGTDMHWKAFYSQKRPCLSDILVDGDVERLPEYFEQHFVNQNSLSAEGYFSDVGGQARYLIFEASLIYDDKGEVEAAIETLWDITPRKKAEEEIRSANAMLHTLLQAIPDMVVFKDAQGRHIIVNKAVESCLGLDQAEMEGKTNEEALPPALAAQCSLSDREAINSGRPVYYEEEAGEGDSKLYLHTVKSPIFDENGNFMGLVAVSRDITERKKAEEELKVHRGHLEELVRERTEELNAVNNSLLQEIANHELTENQLRQSEEWFRRIYENSPIGIELYDTRGRLIDVNKACLEIFGVDDADEVRGFNLFEDPNLKDEIKKRLLNGENVRYEGAFDFDKVRELDLYRTNKTGVIYLDMHIAHLNTGGMSAGNPVGFLVQLQDATERRKLEQQLRHAQKMEAIGQLAGGIAHDFNNIIFAISNFAYLLSIRMDEDDPARDYVTRIREAAERAASLTGKLLAFSRKQVIDLRVVDLNSIVRNVEKLLASLIGEDIELTVQIEDKSLAVMADSSQVEQVLVNLATNARDAMPGGGALNIETAHVEPDSNFIRVHGGEHPGPYALLSITDTGGGIDEATRENIFEPFFTTKDIGKGTGLGLSIVYGIVNQHGGFIDVKSRPGEGTTFEIYLPVVESETEQAGAGAFPIPRGRGETVLLAEDDPSVREVARDVLQEYGYRVVEAVNGEDAVIKYRDNKDEIQLVILDLVMPKKRGKEAYEEIKVIDPGVKALFISGYGIDAPQRRDMLGEDVHFVSKPVTPH